MGYLQHKTIIVKGYREEVERLHREVSLIMTHNYPDLVMERPDGPPRTLVSNVVVSPANGFASFFIAPDGSKEGWGTSDAGDLAFEQIKRLLNSRFGEWVDYVELEIGGDDGCTSILDTNLRRRRALREE